MVQQVHHPAFPQPASDDVKIWRYLTESKFEWMATESRLFMPSAEHLGDKLEGTQPLGDAQWWLTLSESASSPKQRKIIDRNREKIRLFAAAFRPHYYVSCWHVNETINHEMWRNYANTDKSVAISTTFGKLRAALPAYVNIGLVRYIDYAIERLPTLNMFEYITHKDMRFKPENELRAVVMHPIAEDPDHKHFQAHHFEAENNPKFRVYAPQIKSADLISGVFIHPEATRSFENSVEALCKSNGILKPQRAFRGSSASE